MNLPDATVGISVSSRPPNGSSRCAWRRRRASWPSRGGGGEAGAGGGCHRSRTAATSVRAASRERSLHCSDVLAAGPAAAERVRFYLAWPVWQDTATSEEAELALYRTPIRVARVADADDRPAIALEYRRCGGRWRPTPTLASLSAEGSRRPVRTLAGDRRRRRTSRWSRGGRSSSRAGWGAADRMARALRRDWPAELTTDYQLNHTPRLRSC